MHLKNLMHSIYGRVIVNLASILQEGGLRSCPLRVHQQFKAFIVIAWTECLDSFLALGPYILLKYREVGQLSVLPLDAIKSAT